LAVYRSRSLRDALDSAAAGPLFCGGITVFNPLVQFDLRPTQRVGVVGIGGLGHLALQFLNKWGCEVTAFSSSAGKEAEARDIKEIKGQIEDFKKKIVAAGLQIYYPTPAEREVFRKKANMPAVWKELATPWLDKKYPGQNMTEKILADLDKVASSVKR